MAEEKNQFAKPSRRIQNFLVVWLDASIDEAENEDCDYTIAKLHEIVKEVDTFTLLDECVDFINNVKEEKIFLIASGYFGQKIVPLVHDFPQVSKIYIFCSDKARHEQWAADWSNVEGVFTDIESICEALTKATQACDQNSMVISLIVQSSDTIGQNLNELDQSFMYTQILKEILLTIDFDRSHIKSFIKKSSKVFAGNKKELKNVKKIERKYDQHSPIWWYTYQSFLYSTLNRALRLMEVDLIVSMGFFICDLHQHITTLHRKQFGRHACAAEFTVYRGQGMTKTAFSHLLTMQGGLLSFNNFLSTTVNREVSLSFARHTMRTSHLVGIVFVLNINPLIPSTPFANIRDVSYCEDENEILFSMHSIFRIREIKQLDDNQRLWEVGLTLTSDDDPQLRILTDYIREETAGSTGWHRLGDLMITLGQYNQAERLYEMLLKQTSAENQKISLIFQLGRIKHGQGKYSEAIILYEKSIKINEKILSPTDPDLSVSYNNIGLVYSKMREYSKALSSHEKALAIKRKTLHPNHPSLATSYNNIGSVYDKMNEHFQALSFYEQALEIRQTTLPSKHPDLASSYNNIGGVYKSMREYPRALLHYETALEMYQRTLPPNHPLLATCYNNIGGVYYKMKNYFKALPFFERALDIQQRALPSNHPHLQATKEWIEIVKMKF